MACCSAQQTEHKVEPAQNGVLHKAACMDGMLLMVRCRSSVMSSSSSLSVPQGSAISASSEMRRSRTSK
eukprot:scaffold263461_cov21-Tisochrysis_lutea.AAC.1